MIIKNTSKKVACAIGFGRPKEEFMKKDAFFSKMDKIGLTLAYAEVRLKTGYSAVDLSRIDLSSRFSRNVPVNLPIVGSPMDTVTEHKMAISLALEGGIGIIHRSLSPKDQEDELTRVKFHLNGLIRKPVSIQVDDTMKSILNRIADKGYDFRSFPVLDKTGKLVGLLTGNDFEFCLDHKLTAREIMSKDLKTAGEKTTTKEAFGIMVKNKKKILPLINSEKQMVGMYVFTDVKRITTGGSPLYNVDANGNLRVGAAVGIGEDAIERAELLVRKNVDVLVIDTAHGDSKNVLETLKKLKKNFPGVDVVVGNVSQPESAKRLAKVGADGIKVGQGPGSICTTRIVAGVGRPQLTAVYECAKVLRGSNVPVCADGGIKDTGDIPIAIGAGAHTVMLGNMLAGTKEAPGEVRMHKGVPVKVYRGMGSMEAMEASKAARERYGQGESKTEKLIPEGVKGFVPYKGEVSQILFQCKGGLTNGMGYVGASNIKELQKKADFDRISGAGIEESHPHSLLEMEDTSNYKKRG